MGVDSKFSIQITPKIGYLTTKTHFDNILFLSLF